MSGVGRVGAFDLLDVVGRGAAGTVWRASVPGVDAFFAVKVLDEVRGAEFNRELNAVARLDHPAIALVVDHGIVGPEAASSGSPLGAPFVAMELADGTLSSAAGALGWSEVRDALTRLLAALGHAHARGILHRDVKPQNVLVTPGGVQLTDFGLSLVAEPSGGRRGADGPLLGTPAYMAPEQCEGTSRDHGPFTDLYAVGAVAWTLTTGAPPFGHGLTAIRGHLMSDPPRFRPRFEVPAGLEGWIRRLLQKRPERRFDRAVIAAEALAEIGGRPSAPVVDAGRRSLAVRGAGLRLFGLRERPVIGRSAECAALEQILAEVVAERHPAVVLVEGPSGVGKSRLARWLSERAHERWGLEVVRVVHSDAPDARHGWRSAVVDAVGDGLAGPELEQRVARVLRLPAEDPVCRALVPWADPSAPQPASQAGVVGWIRHLGRGRGVVLSIDDLQWCDEGLLDGIAELVAGPLPLLVVATIQREALAEAPSARRAAIDAFRARAAVRTLAIGVVPTDQQQAMVRELLPLEPELLERVADRTAGNPLFTWHLLADWVGQDLLEVGAHGFRLRTDQEPPLPSSVRAAWQGRIERLAAGLAPGDRTALALAATLGQRVDTDEWRAACLLAGAEASAALVDALVVGGLAELEPRGLAFVHGMLRESLVSWSHAGGESGGPAPPVRRAELERLCAVALQGRSPAPFARIGRHFAAAGAFEDALDPLYVGATREVHQGNRGVARALLAERERSLRGAGCADDDPRWAEQLLVATEIELNLNHDVAAARTAIHAARARLERGGRPVRMARALQLVAAVEFHEGGVASALPWLDEAARVAERADAPWLSSNLAAARLNARVTLGEGLAQTERELQELLRSDPNDRAYVLLQLASVARLREDRVAFARWTEEAEAALRAERRPDGIAVCLGYRGDCARWAGDRALARELYAEAVRLLADGAPLLAEALVLSNALLAEDAGDRSWVPAIDALIEAATAANRMETLTGAHPVRLLATTSDTAVEVDAFDRHLDASGRWFVRSRTRVHEAREALRIVVARLERQGRPDLAARATEVLQLHVPT